MVMSFKLTNFYDTLALSIFRDYFTPKNFLKKTQLSTHIKKV